MKFACKGLWADQRHVASQFSYLSGDVPPLNEVIGENYKSQICNIEKFLLDQCKIDDFLDDVAAASELCNIEHGGSTTWKEIVLLVRHL